MISEPNHSKSKATGVWPAAIVAGCYLLLAILLMPAYGPTWDHSMGEYIQGERWLAAVEQGHLDVLAAGEQGVSLTQRAPHLNTDQLAFHWYQIYPVSSLLSALSCQLLWTKLGLFTSLIAHHIVIPLMVTILLFVLVHWTQRRLGMGPGVCAGLLLVLSPRFFAHSFNNLKDVPETCFYTLALLAAFLALTKGKRAYYCAAAALSALALAQKANALFIPIHILGFIVLDALLRRRSGAAKIQLPWSSLLIATALFAATYLAVSPPMWVDTWHRLRVHFGEIARVGRSGSGEISMLGAQQFLWTTPPMLLALGLIGLFSKTLGRRARLFLGLGLAIPLGRTMLPGMRNFDGVRHFIEFYPFLCILAAAGIAQLLRICSRREFARPLLYGTILLFPALATMRGHPNSICYFNSFIGGLKGAQAARIPEATDYWGNSYWQGLDWLNAHADAEASLLVPLGDQIVVSAAPLKLRRDIHLCDASQPLGKGSLYVMYVTRRGRYLSYLEKLDRQLTPVHEITAYGAPILRILKVQDPDLVADTYKNWQEGKRLAGYAPVMEILAWIDKEPDQTAPLLEILLSARGEPAEITIAKLKAILPPRLHQRLDAKLPYLLAFVRAGTRSPGEGR